MAAWEQLDISKETLIELEGGYWVDENRLAVAFYEAAKRHLFTTGIAQCKGITLYNPAEQHGVLAHLSATPDLDKTLDRLGQVIGPIKDYDVCVVQAMKRPIPGWPELDDVVEYYTRQNPGSLRVDTNQTGKSIRGMALDLADGTVHEINGMSCHTQAGAFDDATNHYLALPNG